MGKLGGKEGRGIRKKMGGRRMKIFKKWMLVLVVEWFRCLFILLRDWLD